MYAELPPLGRYVLLAAAAVGLWFVLRWVDEEDAPQADRVAIHVKLKFGGDVPSDQRRSRPRSIALFSTTSTVRRPTPDPRTRWWEIDVAAPRCRTPKLAELLAEPGVEEAYIEPLYTLPSSASARPPTRARSRRRPTIIIRTISAPHPAASTRRAHGRPDPRARASGSPISRAAGTRRTRISPAIASPTSAASRSSTRAGARTAPRCSARSSAATTARA